MREATHPQVKVFAKSAACVVEAHEASGYPTVNFEIAKKSGQAFSWDEKIVFQLNPGELSDLAALFLGLKESIHIKRPDKGLELIRQQGSLFLKASAGQGKLYVMPIPPSHVFQINALMLNQLQRATKMTDQQALIQTLRGAYALER